MFAKRTNWNLSPNRLTEALEAHRIAGRAIFDLTVSNPTECGFIYDTRAILAAISQPMALQYKPVPMGLYSAREAVASYYSLRGRTVTLEDILLTTGTSEAYAFALRLLCDTEDDVLVPAPSYPLLEVLADLQDVRLVRYPLLYDHGWVIDFHALKQAVTPQTRAVILVHPNNPTGHFCSPQQARNLNEFCAAHRLALIVDEVFFDFSFGKDRPASFAGNSDVLTFTLSGLSKICGLPQMKMAWMVVSGPEQQKREALARLEVIADAYLSMNTPTQLAAMMLLNTRHGFQRQLLERVKTNRTELDRQLSRYKMCSRLKSEGGWNAVLRVPASESDEELAVRLLAENRVYVHPGHFYDFPGNGHLVLSLITPPEMFAKGLASLLEFFSHD